MVERMSDERTPVAKLFEYQPDAINLIGYNMPLFLSLLSQCLGERPLFAEHSRKVGGVHSVIPSFPLKYIHQRGEFFDLVPEVAFGHNSPFDFCFPTGEEVSRSPREFFEFCDNVYDAVEGARKELRPFRNIPEVRTLLGKIRGFDRELVATLRRLKEFDESHLFAVDTDSGEIVRINRMPKGEIVSQWRSRAYTKEDVEAVNVRMKQKALALSEGGIEGFRAEVREFVRDEFKANKPGSLRQQYELLAVPTKLAKKHGLSLRACANYEPYPECYDEDASEIDTCSAIPHKFGDYYDMRELYTPTLLNSRRAMEHTPITFKTERGERKFLLVGLHSGGKSFLLDNLVALSIAGQVPLMFPAERLMMPMYKRMFYHRGTGRTRRGLGKCETEVCEIRETLEKSRRGCCVYG